MCWWGDALLFSNVSKHSFSVLAKDKEAEMQIGDAKLALIWVIWGTKQLSLGISLVVLGLGLRPSNARGTDSILDKGYKIPHGMQKKIFLTSLSLRLF